MTRGIHSSTTYYLSYLFSFSRQTKFIFGLHVKGKSMSGHAASDQLVLTMENITDGVFVANIKLCDYLILGAGK